LKSASFENGSRLLGLLNSKRQILETKNALERENEFLRVKLNTLEILKFENEQLKGLFNRIERGNPGVLVRIISGSTQSPYDTLVVDRGSENGIKSGDWLLAGGEFPIATISEVYGNLSKATMFSAPNRQTEIIVGKTGIIATAIGRGSGNFEAKISKEIEVNEGDSIRLPEAGSEIFAVVESIFAKPTDALQTIIFKNPVNATELEWLVVRDPR